METVRLKPGREKSALRHHPWLFSGAVAAVDAPPENGATVRVTDSRGGFLGYAAWSEMSQLKLRFWSFAEDHVPDGHFFRDRLERAWRLRLALGIPERSAAWRLVHAEADGLPGVVIDCYRKFAVIQLSSAGAERCRGEILAALAALRDWDGIYERSDLAARSQEGLPERTGLLAGAEPPELLEIREDDRKFLVDLRHGHKTGFYCDQRENRSLVQRLATGRSVLNLFCYTGGFGVAAALGGACHVTNVDTSRPALELAERNFALNGIGTERFTQVEADCFSFLRRCRGEKRRFDLIVLDPPKLVDSKQTLARGARAYKDAALQSMHLLNPGGMLFTFSCSGWMKRELFAKVTADAALDAHCDLTAVMELGQAPDHPVPCAFPEARYLKGQLLLKR